MGAFKTDWSLSNFGVLAGRTGSVIKGWMSFGKSGYNQDKVVKATIAKDAKINIKGEHSQDLSSLNRDENRMVETAAKDEYTYPIGIPIIDLEELNARWQAKETLLQKAPH